jgi:hypothetical protein
MKQVVSSLAFACFAIANGQSTISESDQVAVKEHLIKLEKQSWEACKNRDGKFFRIFFRTIMSKLDLVD